MRENIFKSRTVTWIILLGSLSLLATVLLTTFADDGANQESWANDTFSKSAIGHRAFVELMRRSGIPVLISRHSSGVKAGGSAALLLLEPYLSQGSGGPQAKTLSQIMNNAWTILLVLPKWTGHPHAQRSGWIHSADLVPVDLIDTLLAAVGLEAELVRSDSSKATIWTQNALGPEPAIERIQLLRSEMLTPLCSCEQGILVGEWSMVGDRLVVLSDPDVLANHTLAEGQNAAFALRLIDELRGEAGTVIVDETLHGYRAAPTLLRSFLDFPLILVLCQVMVIGVALLWITVKRFGPSVATPPELRPGKGYLIDNTARLLHYGGHDAHILQRYVHVTLQDVARQLHIPPTQSLSELGDRLQHLTALRRSPIDLHAILAAVEDVEHGAGTRPYVALEIASKIHRWRKEMTHEP